MQFHEDDNQIKRFLLGDVTSEEEAQLEDRLFDDSDFVRQLEFVEEELIDDYLCGRLMDDERIRFESHFMTPRSRPVGFSFKSDWMPDEGYGSTRGEAADQMFDERSARADVQGEQLL